MKNALPAIAGQRDGLMLQVQLQLLLLAPCMPAALASASLMYLPFWWCRRNGCRGSDRSCCPHWPRPCLHRRQVRSRPAWRACSSLGSGLLVNALAARASSLEDAALMVEPSCRQTSACPPWQRQGPAQPLLRALPPAWRAWGLFWRPVRQAPLPVPEQGSPMSC
jgi:hypothetical protein